MKNNRGETELGIIIILIIAIIVILFSCNEQNLTKNWGGEMTINLKPGQKLELVTWKDNELWILTRPMEEDEKAVKWTYAEDSEFGILEGTIYIQEHSISSNKAD